MTIDTDAIDSYTAELTEIRRDIHRHPELGLEEVRTSALVAEKLRSWGIEVETGLARTGVVGTLKGKLPGQRAIALRADMDALPLEEKTGLSYRSETPGCMHACGHDGHTTMLLGAARYLAEHPEFGGTVHFIFQPAEENHGGGRIMVEEGLFDRFPCDAVYGLHNKPGIEVGSFATRKGPMLAAADRWVATFRGTGGHGGSAPHLATDASIPLAHFILGVQTIIGRNVPALQTAVLSVGHILAGQSGAGNVMPSEIVVEGTARSYLPAIRDLLERRLGELARSLAEAYGCQGTVTYERNYPPLINHAEQVGIAVEVARGLVGDDHVDDNMTPITAGEDLSFMLEKKPGMMMMIGNGTGIDGRFHNVHTPHYDFNDAILPLGIRYWVGLVGQELGPI